MSPIAGAAGNYTPAYQTQTRCTRCYKTANFRLQRLCNRRASGNMVLLCALFQCANFRCANVQINAQHIVTSLLYFYFFTCTYAHLHICTFILSYLLLCVRCRVVLVVLRLQLPGGRFRPLPYGYHGLPVCYLITAYLPFYYP